MSEDLRISVHHVGGRGGTRRFPVLEPFEGDLSNALYEADALATEEIAATTQLLRSKQYLLPVCVSGSPGRTSYYKLYNSGASSVLAIDPIFMRSLPWLGESTVDMDDHAWSAIEVSQLEGSTLDSILNIASPIAPAPDFLSINTQGNEAEILAGGAAILSQTCIALQCEVSFRPIYTRQASLNDLTEIARRFGFDFVKLIQHGLRGHGLRAQDESVRTPIGLRGGGVMLQSDAVYFKAPNQILDNHRRPMLDLLKGIFIGFVLEYFDYSFACATLHSRHAKAAEKELVEWGRERFSYLDFVAEYLNEFSKYPRVYPPAWTQIFPAGSDQPRDARALREIYFRVVDKAAFKAALETLMDPEYVLLEKVAIRFGMVRQADLLRGTRRNVIYDTLLRLGLLRQASDSALSVDYQTLDAV